MTDRLRGGLSWSASRHGAFATCERAYFYQYYLGAGRAEEADPERVAAANFLKHLTSLPLWIGSEVHETIEGLLRSALAGGPADGEAAIASMTARMRRGYRESIDDVARAAGDPRGTVRFIEHEYARPVAPEVWKARVDEAHEMVRAFTRLPYLELMRGLARRDLLGLEKLESWTLEGVPVWVKIDLAYAHDGLIHILDWKTGRFERGENPLQMVGYALFARQAWQAEVAALRVREVYLRQSDPEKPCLLDDEVLANGRQTIASSIQSMRVRLSDPERNLAREEAFALTTDERNCQNCNFQRICPRWSGA